MALIGTSKTSTGHVLKLIQGHRLIVAHIVQDGLSHGMGRGCFSRCHQGIQASRLFRKPSFFYLGLALGQSPSLIHDHQVDIANLVHDLAAFNHDAHTGSPANGR